MEKIQRYDVWWVKASDYDALQSERDRLAFQVFTGHRHCHDLVCNCDYGPNPRGAKGVGCSCAGRDTAYAQLKEITAERDALLAEREALKAQAHEDASTFALFYLDMDDLVRFGLIKSDAANDLAQKRLRQFHRRYSDVLAGKR